MVQRITRNTTDRMLAGLGIAVPVGSAVASTVEASTGGWAMLGISYSLLLSPNREMLVPAAELRFPATQKAHRCRCPAAATLAARLLLSAANPSREKRLQQENERTEPPSKD